MVPFSILVKIGGLNVNAPFVPGTENYPFKRVTSYPIEGYMNYMNTNTKCDVRFNAYKVFHEN